MIWDWLSEFDCFYVSFTSTCWIFRWFKPGEFYNSPVWISLNCIFVLQKNTSFLINTFFTSSLWRLFVYSNIPENLQKTRDIWGGRGGPSKNHDMSRGGRGVKKWPKKGHVVCVRPLCHFEHVWVFITVLNRSSLWPLLMFMKSLWRSH